MWFSVYCIKSHPWHFAFVLTLFFWIIRQAKDVIRTIKKRLKNKNANTQLFTVMVSTTVFFTRSLYAPHLILATNGFWLPKFSLIVFGKKRIKLLAMLLSEFAGF